MWGIVPAAGSGSRLQPLAFSKELLPVGNSMQHDGKRLRVVSEYLIERMAVSGIDKICMIIAPGKSDILRFYGYGNESMHFCYIVQQEPRGLCDAVFNALPFIGADEHIVIGLPDTIWFPVDGLKALPDRTLSFLLFPVKEPQWYDAVELYSDDTVKKIKVKQPEITSSWIWGAIKMDRTILSDLFSLWISRNKKDEYFGTLVNEYLEKGGTAIGCKAGRSYVDVGTLNGYHEALRLLNSAV